MTPKSLKLIKGGRPRWYLFTGIQLAVSTRETLPDKTEIMIFEEDTKMVLTVDKEVTYREEHPIRIMTDIYAPPHHRPGSLVMNGKNWYALVIDLDADVVCQPAWIEEVYEVIFNRLKAKKIRTAGIHLLGSTYGKIPVEQALEMFFAGLKSRALSHLKKIYLVVDDVEVKGTHKQMAKYLARTCP